MRKTIAIGVSVLALLAAAQANAADVYSAPAAGSQNGGLPYATASWDGFYLGGHLGGASTNGNATLTENPACLAPCTPPPPQIFHQNLSGREFIGGAQAGYNWQRGNTVLGAESDLSFGNKIDYLASFRGRAGWAANDWLFYGTGGVAFIGAENKGSFTISGGACLAPCTPTPPMVFPFDASEHRVGYVVGGGVETKLTQNLSAGVEGLYYGFDSTTFKHGSVDQVAAQGISEVAELRGRFSWHFNNLSVPLK